ncbi:ORF6C domain-containing protein [Paenibacillus bouchesdurhonensis]|uniref:ORF6C domain-containing protein n=1 Tax=Paenibacillus bouchesdurhonensis TaxID=1870990 RepID=UPI000DA5ED10|nr:ORF6C domain-containing protein [Paenibacillus bouchesdurhonensis]
MNKLRVINHKDQRVLTTAQLAETFGTENKIITNNFSRNKDRYTAGKHYFELRGQELDDFKGSHQFDTNLKFAPVVYLWTEKGAWMHAKSLNTDQAWEAYEMLVDDYYRIKSNPYEQLSQELQAIFLLDQRTQAFEVRVTRLENNTTIDYGQQNDLQLLANKVVVSMLGGKESPAYLNKTIRGETYSALWRDFKGYFNTNSYKNTLVKDFDKAKEYVSSWRPHGKLLRDIEQANSQLAFN